MSQTIKTPTMTAEDTSNTSGWGDSIFIHTPFGYVFVYYDWVNKHYKVIVTNTVNEQYQTRIDNGPHARALQTPGAPAHQGIPLIIEPAPERFDAGDDGDIFFYPSPKSEETNDE